MKRWALAALALLALGGLWWQRRAAAEPGQWLKVERRDLPLTVEISGQLRAEDAVSVTPPQVEGQWDFKISFLVPEGTEVQAGQPIVGFDTSELESQLDNLTNESQQAGTELEKKRAELAREHQDLELSLAEAEARLRKLQLETQVPPELVAALEKDKKKIDRDLAEREVAFLRQKVELAGKKGEAQVQALEERRRRALERVQELEAAIRSLMVGAPKAGTVIFPGTDFDEKIKIGSSVWAGRALIEIPDLSRLRGQGRVDEADVGKIALGQPATLTLDAYPDEVLRGKVVEIGNSVDRQRSGAPVKQVAVVVELERSGDRRFRPGMRFRGKIETGSLKAALLVPSEAVAATAGGPRVFRKGALGPEPVAVELGGWGEGQVEVKSGLAEGDRILARAPEQAG